MSGVWYFLGSFVLLLAGYTLYGAFVEKVFGIDRSRPTPLQTHRDGVDYVPLPRYKIFLVQLLNIAGLGPVLGPILGALYGPSALLWVVFGCIFGGATHDFCAGMMSLRYGGASYPEIIGRNLGTGVRRFMEGFTIIFMIMVGAVFVLGPAKLLESMSGVGFIWWSALIFAYYFVATIMPIDKIIGRIYPIFSVLLLLMAFGLTVALLWQGYEILPNTNFFVNTDPSGLPIWPLLFITIACGAISGFHATQSPLMARCIENERDGRMLFYGPMIAEGALGLIWVTLGLSFYQSPEALAAVIKAGSPTLVVKEISVALLGPVGGALALLGVVVLPISTGDTAFRSARLLVADTFHIQQATPNSRVLVAIPLFLAGIALTFIDFAVIWRYFGWANQSMACVTLWSVSVYLARRQLLHWISTLPAVFMTAVCTSYLCYAKIGFGLPLPLATGIGIALSLACLLIFLKKGASLPEEEAAY
ncbi:MAG: carbon starvation protein A [Desulfovibrionaceae bacterium]|nr:carbon starvation protein A [Desulfovibrionaceae bacterium]